MTLHIYTDGSARPSESSGRYGGWGFTVMRKRGKSTGRMEALSDHCGHKTGAHIQEMEIKAMREAVRHLIDNPNIIKHHEPVMFYSDYQPMITAIKLALNIPESEVLRKIKPVYQGLVHDILYLKEKVDIMSFAWVPAHTGIQGNERADKLAFNAAKAMTLLEKSGMNAEDLPKESSFVNNLK